MSTVLVRHERSTGPLVSVVIGILLLAGTAHIALATSRGQRWDDWAMTTVVAGRDTRLAVLSVLGYISIGAIVAVAVGCLMVALLRSRVNLAIAAVVVLAGSNLTTQVLKHQILDRPDLGLGTLNSLPSGHTTVVASAVGAALLVAPAGLHAAVALAGAFATTLTGASTIVAGWHRPADVVAALVVSVVWTALAAAVVGGHRQISAAATGAALVGAAAALGLLVLLGVRPVDGWDGFFQAGLVLGAVSAVTAAFVTWCAAVAPAS